MYFKFISYKITKQLFNALHDNLHFFEIHIIPQKIIKFYY